MNWDAQHRIVAELDAWPADVDGLKRPHAETELDVLPPTILDRAFAGESQSQYLKKH